MQTKITRLNHTGEGIGEINGKIVFVEKTIPGDIVELSNLIDHGNYYQATPKKYLQKSPDRIKVDCPYYQICGGCHLMGLTYQKQLEYKKEKVKNILKKYSNLEVEPSIIKSPLYHYRNKITLQVQDGLIGLFKNNSNILVPIKECLLIDEQMNHIIHQIQNTLDLSQIEKIMLRTAKNQLMVQFIGQIEPESVISSLNKKATSIYLNENLIYGLPQIEEVLGEYKFYISPYSFFQVNHTQTIRLYEQIKTYLGSNNNHVLDLYCGTGSIGIYISKYCKKITGIEINPSSVKDANKNIQINHLKNIKIKQGDVGKVLSTNEEYDAIIVDPPRSGLDKKTKATLLKIGTPKIIYVSCNPITLARDLNTLKEYYDLKELTAIDMFPNTYHVETVCVLKRK